MEGGEISPPAKIQKHIFYGVAAMPVEWAIILVVAVSDAILLTATSFRLEASSERAVLVAAIGLAMVFVYCRWRRLPKLAHLCHTVLVLVVFGYAFSILAYILTGILPLPRWDEALATADHALGLNWLDMYQWLTRHPAIEAGARAVYMSLGPEMLILLITMELLGHHHQARTFLLWVIVSVIGALGIGILIPAAGAVVYYHLPVAPGTVYVSQMAGLRDGTLRTIDPFGSEGLVVFPSYHTALAVLCAYTAWPLHKLKYPLLVLNLLIILSSPAEGAHYFIDIIAGIILAALTIRLFGYIQLEAGKEEGARARKPAWVTPSAHFKQCLGKLEACWPWADRALALLTVSIALVVIYRKTPQLAVVYTGLVIPLFVLAFVFRSPRLAGPLPSASGFIGMALSYPALAFLEIPSAVPSEIASGYGGRLLLSAAASYILVLAWSFYAIGRSFALFPSARKLVTRGPYAFVRHPIYSSFLHLALCITVLEPGVRNIAAAVIMALGIFLRARSEENLLSRGEGYGGFCNRVKNRFFHPILSAPLLTAAAVCIANYKHWLPELSWP
jgi:protein-S-isoprenylcysteine O-methyltransferase Ste14/membrane-associated phospholipid phosphatase